MKNFLKLIKHFQRSIIFEHFFSGVVFFIISVETSILVSYLFDLRFTRNIVFFGFIIGFILAVAEFVFYFLMFSSKFRVARFIERNNPELKDYVTSTLTLPEVSGKYYSEVIVSKAIANAIQKIKQVNPLYKLGEKSSLLNNISILIIVLFLITSIIIPFDSYQRLEYLVTGRVFLKPNTNVLLSRYGGQIIEGEDFNFQIIPLKPELKRIIVYTRELDESREIFRRLEEVNTNIKIVIPNCRSDFEYELEADGQEFGPYKVTIVKRPEIESISILVTPPKYTNMKSFHSKSGDLRVPQDSILNMEITFNKDLLKADLKKIGLTNIKKGKVEKNRVRFEFSIIENYSYQVIAFDTDGISFESNIMNIEVIPDSAPIVKLTKPGKDLSLKSIDMKIKLEIFTEDDYGLTEARLVFFISDFDQKYQVPLKTFRNQEKSGLITFNWPLSILDIKQEDYITYYIEVFDNAVLSNRGVSKTYTISFKNTKEQIEEFISEQEDIITSLEKIKNKSEAIQLELNAMMRKYELQNEDKLTWSDKKKLQELLNKEEELITEAAKLREQLKKAEEKFDFDSDTFQDTQEKLDKVKELFDQLLDEKMKEMMNKLKDMLNKSNNLDLQKKNEELKVDSKQMQEMLDRMIKELERLKLEKTIEELIAKTDDLIKKQTEIQENIGKEQGLEKDQEQITDGVKELEKNLKESIEELKEDQPEVVNDLEKTQANSDFKGMEKDSKDLEDSLKQNKNQKSKQQAGSMKKELERLRKNLRSDLDNLKMRGNEGKVDLINLLIRDGIENSRYLKELNSLIEDNQFNITKYSSLAKDDILNSIDILSRQLWNYLELLKQLSMLTIKLDSKMSDRIYASRKSLETSSIQFSFGKVNPSMMFNLQAYRGINLTVLDLMKLKNEIQACASCESKGMEQLLKMLEKLSKKQGDLNEYLEKLAEQMNKNKKPGPTEKEMFDQMQREQRAIREALEKLNKQLQEMKDKKKLLGDMDKLGDEMKDVEKKIGELDIGPETQKKQRKILQRMLDIQKSIHRQDFEKKRKAELDRQKMLDIEKLAPKLKESELFLDFESFWNENYPEIYKEYLKSYFENLNQ